MYSLTRSSIRASEGTSAPARLAPRSSSGTGRFTVGGLSLLSTGAATHFVTARRRWGRIAEAMTTAPSPTPTADRRPLTTVEWLICAVAALGFAFDIYELLMLPLIVRPALLELLGAKPGTPEFNQWVGLLFYVPAVAGGIFGLLGGYLTDLLRPPPGAGLEHPALRLLGHGRRLRHLGGMLLVLPLHDLRRRLRGVRGRGGLAGRAVPRPEAPRERCSATPRPSRRSAACW